MKTWKDFVVDGKDEGYCKDQDKKSGSKEKYLTAKTEMIPVLWKNARI